MEDCAHRVCRAGKERYPSSEVVTPLSAAILASFEILLVGGYGLLEVD